MTKWTQEQIKNFMDQNPLFSILPESVRLHLAQKAKALTYKKGDTILKQGSHGNSLLVICQGKVQVALVGADKTIHEKLLAPNDFFGEIGFLTHSQRTATVLAVEDTQIVELIAEDIRPLTEEYPDFKSLLGKTGAMRSQESMEKLLE